MKAACFRGPLSIACAAALALASLGGCARRGAEWLEPLKALEPGGAPGYLRAVRDQGVGALAGLGCDLVGAYRVAMVSDTECVVIWAIPDWATWAGLERAWLDDGPLDAWRATSLGLGARVRRTLVVDSALSPLRIGRQPEVEDRIPLSEL